MNQLKMRLSWLRNSTFAGLTSVAILAMSGHDASAQSDYCYANGGTLYVGIFDLLYCATYVGAGSPTYGWWGGYRLDVDNTNFSVYLDGQYVGILPEQSRSLQARCAQGDTSACEQYNWNVDSILVQCDLGYRVPGICNDW